MNKDRIEGAVKDATGRVERQAGEWTGDKKMQVKGTLKQAEGKVQNAVGKVEDAAKSARREADEKQKKHEENETEELDTPFRGPRR